jgi:hypothetical protein
MHRWAAAAGGLLAVWACAVAVLSPLWSGVQGCGMTTHDVIAHRAAEYYFTERFEGYRQIIDNFRNAVEGGAPFPEYAFRLPRCVPMPCVDVCVLMGLCV